MINRMNDIKRAKNGFTLVELLVVIAIISILTVITVGQFQTARQKARDVQRKGDTSAVSKALEMFYTDYGYFPDENGGRIVINGSPIDWGGEFKDAAGYVYMKVLPKETDNSLEYCYRVSPDKKKFAVFSVLENKLDKDYYKNPSNQTLGYRCNNDSNYHFGIFSPNTAYAPTSESLQ